MEFIDTHAHLYLNEFKDDIDEVLERCQQKLVTGIVLPNIDKNTVDDLNALSNAHNGLCYPLMGLHPTHVTREFENDLSELFTYFKTGTYYGVGEIGIDLYWDRSLKDEQCMAFEKQVRIALQHDLPVVIHARDSYDEIFSVLNTINASRYFGIQHAFTGNPDQANALAELGFKLGIGGIVTFKNSGLADTVAEIPLEHIVLETDSPFLAPVPFRGKRNESSYIGYVADKIAMIKNTTVQEVSQVTSHNARQVFKKIL
jgi:TatD DNase family protein